MISNELCSSFGAKCKERFGIDDYKILNLNISFYFTCKLLDTKLPKEAVTPCVGGKASAWS